MAWVAIAALLLLLPLASGCAAPAPTPAPELTPPAQGASITFLFFSDTQARPETGANANANANAGANTGIGALLTGAVAGEPRAELVIFGGDTVDDGGESGDWEAFWRNASEPLDGLVVAAVPGNHDNHAMLAEQFAYPARAPASPGEGFFYAIDMGGVHFVMLDSNIMGADRQADIDWLRADLAGEPAQKANWRVAVLHHPLWPPVNNPKDMARAETMRENFLPLLEDYGVDLVLCGHQHVYARSRAQNGIVQIMVASGAKEPYHADNTEDMAIIGGAPSYLRITADAGSLTVTAFDGNHAVFDTLTILPRS
ncbi:MAG: metallophosphoesterase [Oscillospiraceae bacterium]|nr:metallophosphoesterase [Oscillospiraceae bacterium]